MSGQPLRSRAQASLCGKLLALVALLPALLLGPIVGGGAALFHAHGEEGGHVHLVTTAPGEVAAEHPHGPDDEAPPAHDHGEPAAPTLVVSFPMLAAVTHGAAAAAHVDSQRAAWSTPAHGRQWNLVAAPPVRASSQPSPPGVPRTGIAALLRSSHAILI